MCVHVPVSGDKKKRLVIRGTNDLKNSALHLRPMVHVRTPLENSQNQLMGGLVREQPSLEVLEPGPQRSDCVWYL